MVNAPNSHVSPNVVIIPRVLIIAFAVADRESLASAFSILFRVCLIRARITIANVTKLKSRTNIIGPRKAVKNAILSLMKQLQNK